MFKNLSEFIFANMLLFFPMSDISDN